MERVAAAEVAEAEARIPTRVVVRDELVERRVAHRDEQLRAPDRPGVHRAHEERIEARLRQLRRLGAGAVDPIVAVPHEALGLEHVQLLEPDGGQALRDGVEVLGAVHEVEALHAHLEQPLDQLVRPGLALGGLWPVEAGLQRPQLRDVLGVLELVDVLVAADIAALVDRVLGDADPPPRAVDRLLDVHKGLDDHVDPQVVPAVELAAQVCLELPGERVRGPHDELVGARGAWRGKLVPRDLVDHHHGALGPEPVERLPLADALGLDRQSGEFGDPRREIADNVDVRGRQAGAGLGGHRQVSSTTALSAAGLALAADGLDRAPALQPSPLSRPGGGGPGRPRRPRRGRSRRRRSAPRTQEWSARRRSRPSP